MMNAAYAKSTFCPRVIWPPEEMAAQLTYSDHGSYIPASNSRSLMHWSNSVPFFGAVAFSAILVFFLVHYREALAQLGEWGYASVFFVEMANSATVLIPTPGQSYSFALGVVLNPLVIGIVGGTGSAFGELTGYLLGARMGHALRRGRFMSRLHALTASWGGLCLFLFAALPGPFEVAGLWAGTVRYPVWRFLLYVAIGKILKVTAFAVAGYYSVTWLLG